MFLVHSKVSLVVSPTRPPIWKFEILSVLNSRTKVGKLLHKNPQWKFGILSVLEQKLDSPKIMGFCQFWILEQKLKNPHPFQVTYCSQVTYCASYPLWCDHWPTPRPITRPICLALGVAQCEHTSRLSSRSVILCNFA